MQVLPQHNYTLNYYKQKSMLETSQNAVEVLPQHNYTLNYNKQKSMLETYQNAMQVPRNLVRADISYESLF